MTKRLFENQVILGDCLEKMKDIADDSIDMILTDLPYGTTQNKWDSIIDLKEIWNLFHHIIKDTGIICLTSSQPFTSKLVMSNVEEFKHEWVWEKNKGSNFMNTKREPMKEHETILIFSKGKWVYNKQMESRTDSGLKRSKSPYKWKLTTTNYNKIKDFGKDNISELRVPKSIQKFNVERGLHPTQKPVKLFEYLIKTYSNEGDTVLDCCAGSGTTAIACLNLNRNYICIEKDTKYFEVMKERIKNHPQKITEFVTQ